MRTRSKIAVLTGLLGLIHLSTIAAISVQADDGKPESKWNSTTPVKNDVTVTTQGTALVDTSGYLGEKSGVDIQILNGTTSPTSGTWTQLGARAEFGGVATFQGQRLPVGDLKLEAQGCIDGHGLCGILPWGPLPYLHVDTQNKLTTVGRIGTFLQTGSGSRIEVLIHPYGWLTDIPNGVNSHIFAVEANTLTRFNNGAQLNAGVKAGILYDLNNAQGDLQGSGTYLAANLGTRFMLGEHAYLGFSVEGERNDKNVSAGQGPLQSIQTMNLTGGISVGGAFDLGTPNRK